jgi:nitrate/nitrite-specific signal transduction histidine kinase
MGLKIMSERLESISATLRVTSAPGKGTAIEAIWVSTASDKRTLERMGA